jgi:hypothetical protein
MGVAAVVLAVLVVQIAVAGNADDSDGPKATASAPPPGKKFKNFKRKTNRRIGALRDRLEELTRLPGPPGLPGPAGTPGPPGPPGSAPGCGGTMVSAGAVCIDKYEVSVWETPTGGKQYGVESDDYPCDDDGQDCTNIYARSIAGVTPSRFITYFQAQQALANVGKRLPTNAEWQQAVAGTPDPGTDDGATDCNVSGPLVNTGSRSNCVSNWGANDMVGNVWEWVGDWDEEASQCDDWPPAFGDDITCLGRADGEVTTRFPGVLLRGGSGGSGARAGPFAVSALDRPSFSALAFGFRGAR